ncbi:hypothetical protein [uncultured Mucilaginibacter sp.]|uniref:hypothetical protein n=1 Tax=uncultured Mucilaginibacter sp. TaxID=797541 RepID=UPI0026252E9B|nr:hypothetical protein [uncultured Mucilaginibacter sp.]
MKKVLPRNGDTFFYVVKEAFVTNKTFSTQQNQNLCAKRSMPETLIKPKLLLVKSSKINVLIVDEPKTIVGVGV